MKQLRILLPPGIGDIHWVLLKLESWLKQRDAVATASVLEFDRRPRALDFIKLIPFLRAGGYEIVDPKTLGPEFDASYNQGTIDVHEGYRGYDAYFCFNGSLLNGKDLASQVLPECSTNWDYSINELPEDRKYRETFKHQCKKYILIYVSKFGIFKEWDRRLTTDRLNSLLKAVSLEFPHHRLVLTGSAWDLSAGVGIAGGVLNLIGRTPLSSFLSLIRGASAFVGYPGGNTIVSTHLKIPTVMIWGGFYKNHKFRTNWVFPKVLGSTYVTLEVETATELDIVKALAMVISNGKRD